MSRTDRPYSRVYWEIVDDEKFTTVFDDDHALAWWLRLLIAADQAFPTSAVLPAGVHRAALRKLVDTRLVDVAGSRYRIHGLDSERARRARQGTVGAAARWNQPPVPGDLDAPDDVEPPLNRRRADANAVAMRSHTGRFASQEEDETRTRRDETSTARATNGVSDDLTTALVLVRDLTGRYLAPHSANGDRIGRWITRFGLPKVEATLREVATDLGDYPGQNQLLNSTENYLEPPVSAKRETPAQREDREMRERAAAINAQYAKSGSR
jgi:hypothetical protein